MAYIEMLGSFAPYVEGFTDLFNDRLKVNRSVTRTSVENSPNQVQIPYTINSPGIQVDFLKQVLEDKKATADSLMATAKKLGPIAQVVSSSQDAYDAAFESDKIAPLPNKSGTLQGFTLIFFYISLFFLAVISSVVVNQIRGNTMDAMITFGVFLLITLTATALIMRFG
jgi:hypothetical protein